MGRSGDLPAIQVGGRGQWQVERSKLEEYIKRMYDADRGLLGIRRESAPDLHDRLTVGRDMPSVVTFVESAVGGEVPAAVELLAAAVTDVAFVQRKRLAYRNRVAWTARRFAVRPEETHRRAALRAWQPVGAALDRHRKIRGLQSLVLAVKGAADEVKGILQVRRLSFPLTHLTHVVGPIRIPGTSGSVRTASGTIGIWGT